ncbi:MAG: hypothetical protein FJ279_08615 [Planctomycetes bacterium]|nr:hypothetical protein [Planctomycetota bacterium]MBM4083616.1 hypothetical protein [Planctomycetota bacterium]
MGAKKTKDIARGLTSKGFQQHHSHHEMYWFCIGGKKTSIRTRISHSASEYGDNLLAQMARQVQLSRQEFDDLVECPLTQEAYAELLRKRDPIRGQP